MARQHGSSACGENDSTEEDDTPHSELADAVLSQHGSPTCGEDTSTEEQHTALAHTPESAAAPASFEPSMSATKQTKKRGTMVTASLLAEYDGLFGTEGQGDSARDDAYYHAPSSKSAKWARTALAHGRKQRSD